MAKHAIVLFNLGGPDGPDAVQPFLYNLFKDPAIIGLPGLFRIPLAKLISTRRAPTAQAIYAEIGGKSPLLELTRDQATALKQALHQAWPEDDTEVFICMRYWHPMAEQTVRDVVAYQPDDVILLPLYPQYSTTTTGSSLEDWQKTAKKLGLDVPTYSICCYPVEPGWVSSQAALLKESLASVAAGNSVRVLFSAHGLPKKIVDGGDPYQWQVEQSAAALGQAVGLNADDWAVCYQSRVGPLEWIGPSLDDELKRAAADKVGVVILPIAFVSEHSETLVELDIEYKHQADELGLPSYARVPAVGTHPEFIAGLANVANAALKNKIGLGPVDNVRYCPGNHSRCPCSVI
jgi:ferrochelatase